jgi:hypothetical protein
MAIGIGIGAGVGIAGAADPKLDQADLALEKAYLLSTSPSRDG